MEPESALQPIRVGDRLPEHAFDVDHTMVVMSAAATGAFFRGHTDASYAQSQARRDIYLATGPISGLIDRFVTAWCGPKPFLAKRTLTMRESICAGDRIRLTGEIIAISTSAPPGRPVTGPTVEIALEIHNQFDARCVSSAITLIFEPDDPRVAGIWSERTEQR